MISICLLLVFPSLANLQIFTKGCGAGEERLRSQRVRKTELEETEHTSGKANKQLMLLCKFMPLTQISSQPKFENNLSLKSHFGFLFLGAPFYKQLHECVSVCVCQGKQTKNQNQSINDICRMKIGRHTKFCRLSQKKKIQKKKTWPNDNEDA